MDEVHGLRDNFRADVVVLIVDDRQGCGLSTRVHADAEERSPLSITIAPQTRTLWRTRSVTSSGRAMIPVWTRS
jgi:hypothetical protein